MNKTSENANKTSNIVSLSNQENDSSQKNQSKNSNSPNPLKAIELFPKDQPKLPNQYKHTPSYLFKPKQLFPGRSAAIETDVNKFFSKACRQ